MLFHEQNIGGNKAPVAHPFNQSPPLENPTIPMAVPSEPENQQNEQGSKKRFVLILLVVVLALLTWIFFHLKNKATG
jgi:hypothetical protein